jgi:phosphatidylserine/phosphatidylglycerophosphate/cardiolipin synthase-like enzyme
MAISLTLFYGSPNAHNGAAASIASASQKLNTIALCQFRVSLAAVHFLTSLAPCGADPAPVIHYAPTENLERIDVALIDGARHEIDIAAYVLTDWPILQALTRAADRGVKVRIYLDGAQFAAREPTMVFNELAETPGVEIKGQARGRRSDAPQELPNRRAVALHGSRELLGIGPQAAGQRSDHD